MNLVNSQPLLYLTLIALTFGLVGQVQASAAKDIEEIKACQKKYSDRIDYSRCLDSALLQLEREMTTWETNVEFKLKELSRTSGRGEALAIFSKANKDFKQFQKSNCQWQYLAMLPDVATAATMVKECRIYMAKDRIEKLTELSALEF